jgi:hypothetical protein
MKISDDGSAKKTRKKSNGTKNGRMKNSPVMTRELADAEIVLNLCNFAKANGLGEDAVRAFVPNLMHQVNDGPSEATPRECDLAKAMYEDEKVRCAIHVVVDFANAQSADADTLTGAFHRVFTTLEESGEETKAAQ